MREETCMINGYAIRVISLNTVIVGTGAAGYNAAVRLSDFGQKDIAIVTEGINTGTSRNTGSDKQTYYKMSLSGDALDSPSAMARDLFAGGCVDGDIALCEAANSIKCFLNLCEAGVPFPTNRYGEFVGYKTDHDPYARATSIGPLTSKAMTEQLQKKATEKSIPVFDRYLVISIIKNSDNRACGLLTLDKNCIEKKEKRFVLFNCTNIIYCVGGPAGVYKNSVYPYGHSGSSGIAFEAGVYGKNLTEWQYGLASIAPRWNVSGTYMQVLPRFISVDPDGTEHEFLADYYTDKGQCLSMVFCKGYQWPFDSRKALDGSSVIDLLVYREQAVYKRKVYLDFRTNPFGDANLDFSTLSEEAHDYLEKSGACFGTPIERLLHMNPPAVELYRSKGVDLQKERLEISLCSQHCNGGLCIDLWWQTNIPGFFAAGEVAGSHGIYRPGGSALNAGQVGSLRAAQYIARKGSANPMADSDFIQYAQPVLEEHLALTEDMMSEKDNVIELHDHMTSEMSIAGGPIRNKEKMEQLLSEIRSLLADFSHQVCVKDASGLIRAYRFRDILMAQEALLFSMLDYMAHGGKSRGSAIYTDPDGEKPKGLDELFRFIPDNHSHDRLIQETECQEGGCRSFWRQVRDLPEGGGFFENVWRGFRENGNIE